ncbi:hypothetical protein P171DRAFT_482353 [Karstenula rhodostoma CBS 690.94]|uniref:Uncharacterized protein n=1 Tax=Karstenula rhodostoma CBS 690.94 TaxID=1392251 RepID=A0A9P4PRM5_9PLEO|nr:hypothetical protein P171DRAFT_482353 [Karstenula rhodostoma CBS 690.94]
MRARGSPSRGSTSRGGPRGGGAFRGRGQSNENNRDSRRAPNRVIVVPTEFRRHTKDSERTRIITTWKNETGCEVIPQLQAEKGPGRSIITRFELFGTSDKLDKVTQEIEEWIRYSATKTSETTGWAKLSAHIPKEWYQNHMEREQDDRKKKFLKDMEENETTTYKSLDLRDSEVTMKDAFGTGLAKLDPIRLDDEVFIKAVGLNKLEIRGADIKRARSAEQHVKVLMEKVQLRINNKIAYPMYMILDQREGTEEGVIYEKSDAWWPDNGRHPIAPRLLPCVMTSSGPGEYWQDLQPSQYYNIQSEIQRALDIARYEKGSYELSIRLGCLGLKEDVSSIGTKRDQEAFLVDITNKKELDCVVKHWLVDDTGGEELLERLFDADHLLEPATPGTSFGWANKPATLSETQWFPTLRGTWIFKDPNSPQSTSCPYVVQVHWTMDEDGLYEKEYIKFYRLDPGSYAPKENLDIKLLELGWQFSLTSMIPVGRAIVPSALLTFADQTGVKPKYDTASKEPFISFHAGPSLKIITGRIDKFYTVGIKKTAYKLDIVSMWHPGKDVPCLGLNVYHSDWRVQLAKAEQLRAGECVSWGNTVNTFLPDDGFSAPQWTARDESVKTDQYGGPLPGDGIRLLLTKLMELSQIVLQSDPPHVPDYPAIPPEPRDPANFQGILI